MTGAPRVRFPDPVRDDLEAHRAGLADETELKMASYALPCVAITSQRTSKEPLRRSSIGRLFGARVGEPSLGILESKFGGTPYSEEGEDWSGWSFLGQIDLAAATSVLPDDAIRLSGLLRIDFATDGDLPAALRARWFAEPSIDRAVRVTPETVGRWETRLCFERVWTLPEGKALQAVWPVNELEWWEYEQFYPAGYNTDGGDDYHRLLGHKSSGLDEPYSIDDIDAYESLLRLTYDNEAGFAWGTNWIYVLVPREDLLRKDLSRVVVTGANS